LAEIQSRLVQMAAFNQKELKTQAFAKDEENKRLKPSALEEKLRLYER